MIFTMSGLIGAVADPLSTINRDFVSGWGTFLALIAIGFMNQWNAWKTKQHTTAVALQLNNSEVEKREVSQINSSKLDSLKGVTTQIHALVNSSMQEQLRLNMLLTFKIANLTKSPEDAAAAAESQVKYEQHVAERAMATCALKNACELSGLTPMEIDTLKKLLAVDQAKAHTDS